MNYIAFLWHYIPCKGGHLEQRKVKKKNKNYISFPTHNNA